MTDCFYVEGYLHFLLFGAVFCGPLGVWLLIGKKLRTGTSTGVNKFVEFGW